MGTGADVEIQAVRDAFDISDDLLISAWCLHGAASAADAAARFSPEWQRRAFAVSACVFDLALTGTDRAARDRLTLCFAAQVGYRRAGLDPHGTAVYRRVTELLSTDGGPVDQIGTLALQAGVAFLGSDTTLLGTWRRQLDAFAADVGLAGLQSTMFGPARAVITAASSLLAYLRTGNRTQLDAAQTVLTTVLDLSAGQGDHDARWVAAHLSQIADGMGTPSVCPTRGCTGGRRSRVPPLRYLLKGRDA